jgi:hypothetical protein
MKTKKKLSTTKRNLAVEDSLENRRGTFTDLLITVMQIGMVVLIGAAAQRLYAWITRHRRRFVEA